MTMSSTCQIVLSHVRGAIVMEGAPGIFQAPGVEYLVNNSIIQMGEKQVYDHVKRDVITSQIRVTDDTHYVWI